MMSRIRERFAAAARGDALELEQAKFRLAIVPGFMGYFVFAFLWDRRLDDAELIVIFASTATLLLGVLQLGWILWRPGVNHGRRCIGVLLDVCTVTLNMALADEVGAMLYGLYPWIVIGNGFRFGRRYLHFAQALAIGGFVIVLALTPFWQQHLLLDAALILVLIAVPWYVSVLISRLQAASSRLHEARGEAEAANVAKTRFLAAVSHDLRQPMQALSMYASVLKERLTDPDALRVVHGVDLSVKTLEQLFDSLLDISKIESGVIKPNFVAFPIMPLIEHVIESERVLADQKGLALRALRCSASVRSDPLLLERMLKNLLTNAVRYTERGRIIVGCRRLGPQRLRLQVIDTGVGIPQHEQEHIFEEYYQLEGASTQGLGLGLPIVRSLGALLGHRVSVTSAPGRGSVFSIELERAAAVASLPGTAQPAVPPLVGTVVILDDDMEIRRSLGMLLESWGCRCIGGATYSEVEHELRSRAIAPNAALVDYHLADRMTGLEAIERLRRAYGSALPVLLVTGTPNAAALQRRTDVSVALKPVPAGKLRAFLSQSLR